MLYALQHSVRFAVEFTRVIAQILKKVAALGTVPGEVQEWRDYHERYYLNVLPMAGDFKETSHQTEIVRALKDLEDGEERTVARESMKMPLGIMLQHPKCQYDGKLGVKLAGERQRVEMKDRDKDRKKNKKTIWESQTGLQLEGGEKQETIPLLQQWYNRLQPEDSESDEIQLSANEFTVDPAVTAEVQKLWTAFFFHRHIRVEPFTIDLFGPGSSTWHTPDSEPDLLGIMLVGLGDTCSSVQEYNPNIFDGAVNVGEKNTHARLGTWIAFAAGIDCSITPVEETGYLGVITFKIFRDNSSSTESPTDRISAGIASLVPQLHLPCGILLRKKYVLDEKNLSPFDSQLYSMAQETAEAKLLPVLIDWSVYAESYSEASRGVDLHTSVASSVYPLTEHHMAAVRGQALGTKVPSGELTGTDVEWMRNISQGALIPFYTLDFAETRIILEETIGDWGDDESRRPDPREEARASLGYALVLLSKSKPVQLTKRHASDELGRPSKVAKVE
ncbi:hypothetical protein DFH09DRAFT_1084691 [Mycena vulgaris]|nr:hypothetical protein DFH09DRAFT_1084691 [Mycena vulgaris]